MLEVDIRKAFSDFELHVAFEVGQEILVLFGPSGSGKSLTLNCIAGLVRPDEGFIRLGNRILFQNSSHHVPRHKRGIGLVFQKYALFPHLTVLQNLAYGLRFHKRKSSQIVYDMLKRLRLENLAERYPHQLSGGQQQRVALGRALIIEPPLLLLDEPFAALDAGVREQLQYDILRIQKELGLAVIYVTHNLDDAFALGHKLAVLRQGQLQQMGPISEVFHRPNSRTVAEITGVKNIWEGVVMESSVAKLAVSWGQHAVEMPPTERAIGESVIFYIRPEHVKIIDPEKPLTDTVRRNLLEATVETLADRGTTVSMTVSSEGAPESIQLRFPRHSYQNLDLGIGTRVTISLLWDRIVLLPRETEI